MFDENGDVLVGGKRGGVSVRRYIDGWDRHFPVVPSTGAAV
jgi:hypothetical protein